MKRRGFLGVLFGTPAAAAAASVAAKLPEYAETEPEAPEFVDEDGGVYSVDMVEITDCESVSVSPFKCRTTSRT